MNTRWCLIAHRTSPAVIGSLLPVSEYWAYQNPMAIAVYGSTAAKLMDMHNVMKVPVSTRLDITGQTSPVEQVDRVCFWHDNDHYDPTVITALIVDTVSPEESAYLFSAVDSVFFGSLPRL